MQTSIDNAFFSSSNPLAELITGVPSGGVEKSLYAVVERHGRGQAKIKRGLDSSMYRCAVHVSKTDWPVMSKNEDTFTLIFNGEEKQLRVSTALYEDSYSFKLGLI